LVTSLCLDYDLLRGGVRLSPYIPLGLLTVASIAEALGHTVDIVDVNRLPCDAGIKHGRGFEAEAASFIRAKHPDLVGFTTMCHSFPQTIKMAQALSPHALILLGGPQATAVHEDVIQEFPFITAVLRGEVESSLADFLRWAEGKGDLAGVAGVTYRSGGDVVQTPDAPLIVDLDTLPRPAYHLYPLKEFSVIPIEAGRGCPYNCSFCSTSLYFRRRYRMKSTHRLIDEIRTLVEETGCTTFAMVHDMFTVDRRRVVEFCEGIAQSGLPVHWHCSARVDRVDPELLDTMQWAGCRRIFFGIESGSQRIQKIIGKNLDVDQVVPTLAYAQRKGIKSVASFIIGFPDETPHDLQETVGMAVDLLKAGVSDVQINILVPLPGSPLQRAYQDQLLLTTAVTNATWDLWQPPDRALIERFPRIFSSFYSFPLKHLTPESVGWARLRVLLLARIIPRLLSVQQSVHRFMRYLWSGEKPTRQGLTRFPPEVSSGH